METISGLVAHPLLVHIPVVLIPLAAIGVIVIAVRPSLMRMFGPVVAALAGVGFVGALLAANSGEALEERFEEAGQSISKTLHDHAEMGDGARLFALIFFVLVLAWVLFAWWRRRAGEDKAVQKVRKPKVIALVLAVLAVIGAVSATVSVTLTGHSGAESVWENS